jgi:hypothetical protein
MISCFTERSARVRIYNEEVKLENKSSLLVSPLLPPLLLVRYFGISEGFWWGHPEFALQVTVEYLALVSGSKGHLIRCFYYSNSPNQIPL